MQNEEETMQEDIEDEEELAENQPKIKRKGRGDAERIRAYQWKKGQSGNPEGRPKGKTMKEYAKELLACQTEEERQAFLHGIPKGDIWKMAEGNPAQDLTSGGKQIKVIPIYGGASVPVQGHDSDKEDIPAQ